MRTAIYTANQRTASSRSQGFCIQKDQTKYRPTPKARPRQSKKKLLPPRRLPRTTAIAVQTRNASPGSARLRGRRTILFREQPRATIWQNTRMKIARSTNRKPATALAYSGEQVFPLPSRENSGMKMIESSPQQSRARQKLTAQFRGSQNTPGSRAGRTRAEAVVISLAPGISSSAVGEPGGQHGESRTVGLGLWPR